MSSQPWTRYIKEELHDILEKLERVEQEDTDSDHDLPSYIYIQDRVEVLRRRARPRADNRTRTMITRNNDTIIFSTAVHISRA